ncbi:CPBP family intramembrane glutamic endopeptidase [Evansella sp. AB-rgal1]|uniref:CPBP family intramembrane glutamic endopeptidase n=1 Tax=Evansella sp. AB-rgal1 TaxID=3242696 RepID=UPI00359D1D7D
MKKQAEIIKQLTDRELLLNLYLTQMIMLIIAVVLSFLLYRDPLYPLSLIYWDLNHLLLGIGVAIIVVIFELFLAKILPKHLFDDGGINERIFRNRSIFRIAFLSFIVGFSEEILFRGVIQSSFGLIAASLIFAIIHFRYLQNLFLFTFTIVLSFVIGLLFFYTGNLLTVIICHMVVDMLLGWCIRLGVLNVRSNE